MRGRVSANQILANPLSTLALRKKGEGGSIQQAEMEMAAHPEVRFRFVESERNGAEFFFWRTEGR